MRYLLQKIQSLTLSNNARTALAKKNILASLGLKGISILISLQVVPLTINYINPSQYGIWLTLSSIIAWIGYFDLGFAHGFRNKFAEAKAKGDHELARRYVSSTYAILTILFFIIFIIVSISNLFIDWSKLLNVDSSLKDELQLVFQILTCFFCLNIVASIFTTMLTADQKPAIASLIQTGGQVLAFCTIYIFTQVSSGSLLFLALAFSGVPCLFLLITSVAIFQNKKYQRYSPNLKYVQFKLTKNILGVGSQFFIIMISMLLIFQFINIIISRIEGPEVVTQYNIAYKYFNIINMIAVIILTPFWSAFTDAYIKKDFGWMNNALRKLERLWLLCIPITTLMVVVSPQIYSWWIGPKVIIPFKLSIAIGIFILTQILGNIYMYLINGTGKVRIQLIIYSVFALISIPLLTIGCKQWGVTGILIIPIIVFLFQAILGRIQIRKIIKTSAKGIWDK